MQNRSYSIFIGVPACRIWQMLTDPALNRRFFFGLAITSEWRPGSRLRVCGGGPVTVPGHVVDADPGRRLVFGLSSDSPDAGATAWITWEIADAGAGSCRVTVSHDDLDDAPDAEQDEIILWLLSNLKTAAEGAPALAPAPPE
jgi:uncharacterized protein YndB with AHSA1/START domain